MNDVLSQKKILISISYNSWHILFNFVLFLVQLNPYIHLILHTHLVTDIILITQMHHNNKKNELHDKTFPILLKQRLA